MMRFKAATRSLHSKKENLFLHLKIKSLNSMTLGQIRVGQVTDEETIHKILKQELEKNLQWLGRVALLES
jgi:hypothetical protein